MTLIEWAAIATWYCVVSYGTLAVLEVVAALHLRRYYTVRARASAYISWMLIGDAIYSASHALVVLVLVDDILEHFAVGIIIVAIAHTPPVLTSGAWILYIFGVLNHDGPGEQHGDRASRENIGG